MTSLFSLPAWAESLMICLGVLDLIFTIFYLITLQTTFETVSFENRKMPRGKVWLLLIPIVSIVWHFVIVSRLAESIKLEAIAKDITIDEARPAFTVGMAMCILSCLCIVPFVNIFAFIPSTILWIVYWNKIVKYKNLLLNAHSTKL